MTPRPPRSTRCLVAAALVALVLVVAPAQPAATAPGLTRHVIIISFDGTRADALQSVWTASLSRQGNVSWTARTILPSVTLPAHTSMVTGVGPEVHEIRFNDWDPSQDRLTLPSIFTRVRGAGGRVVILMAKPKLRFLVPEDMPSEWLLFPRYRQAAVLAVAAQRFREQRPALLFVHVADPDDVGHRAGWMSEPYMAVVRQIPVIVEGLLAQIRALNAWDETLVIVTSDHGGHGRIHGSARPEDVTIPWIALGGLAHAGTVLTRSIMIYDTAATALYALGIPRPAQWQGRPVQEALVADAPVRR